MATVRALIDIESRCSRLSTLCKLGVCLLQILDAGQARARRDRRNGGPARGGGAGARVRRDGGGAHAGKVRAAQSGPCRVSARQSGSAGTGGGIKDAARQGFREHDKAAAACTAARQAGGGGGGGAPAAGGRPPGAPHGQQAAGAARERREARGGDPCGRGAVGDHAGPSGGGAEWRAKGAAAARTARGAAAAAVVDY